MSVCIQTVKPRARYLGRSWFVRCPLVGIVYTGTLDEALACWRAHRLSYQLNYPRYCK